jgi:hypothetical protein
MLFHYTAIKMGLKKFQILQLIYETNIIDKFSFAQLRLFTIECEICDSEGNDYEDYCLLGYDTMWFGRYKVVQI